MNYGIEKKRVIDLGVKTTLGYIMFFLMLFSVPFSQDLYSKVTDSDLISSYYKDAYLVINEKNINIEIADSHNKRREGLSGRDSLNDDEGLFFKFEDVDYHGIWMKDMNFPIDIIWLSNTLQVIHIEENVDPSTYPDSFVPSKPAKYVLEVKSGFVKSNFVALKDQATILNR